MWGRLVSGPLSIEGLGVGETILSKLGKHHVFPHSEVLEFLAL